jgi:hypothetical protein
MKIALIGPGIMPIPPNTWGAVEMMIWDYSNILCKYGIEIDIINTPNREEILQKVNSKNYDIVHLHYDIFIDIIDNIKCKLKIVSSHYPFINNPEHYIRDNYYNIVTQIVNNKEFYIFASSQKDIDTFVKFGAIENNTFLNKLGVEEKSYLFYENPEYDRTLCFSQIVDRKRQYLIQDLLGIDFMGRLDDNKFSNFKNYKGEVGRDFLNKEISKYSNFILISSIENTTPLAVKEALICGLGVVVSESVSVELDSSLDFIEIVPELKINDINYIKNAIDNNKNISKNKRQEIRDYGIEKFSLEKIIKNSYLCKLKDLLNNQI